MGEAVPVGFVPVAVLVEAGVPRLKIHTGNAGAQFSRGIENDHDGLIARLGLHAGGELRQARLRQVRMMVGQGDPQAGFVHHHVAPEGRALIERELKGVPAVHQIAAQQRNDWIGIRAMTVLSAKPGKPISAAAVHGDPFASGARMPAPHFEVEFRASDLEKVLLRRDQHQAVLPRFDARAELGMQDDFGRVDAQTPFVAGIVVRGAAFIPMLAPEDPIALLVGRMFPGRGDGSGV